MILLCIKEMCINVLITMKTTSQSKKRYGISLKPYNKNNYSMFFENIPLVLILIFTSVELQGAMLFMADIAEHISLYLLSQSWHNQYLSFCCCFPWPPCFEKFLTWPCSTSAAAVLFLSCSASDRGLTGNCHCDGCQVLGCGQALTFASFGYTSWQLTERKCTNANKTME